MSAKDVRFSSDARDRTLRGVDILNNAVKATLGPKGRNVILDKSYGAPRITKDGVTVAKEIELEDKFENMGAQMVREVASKTSDIRSEAQTRQASCQSSCSRRGQARRRESKGWTQGRTTISSSPFQPTNWSHGSTRISSCARRSLNRHTLSATAVGVAFGGRGRHERPA